MFEAEDFAGATFLIVVGPGGGVFLASAPAAADPATGDFFPGGTSVFPEGDFFAGTAFGPVGAVPPSTAVVGDEEDSNSGDFFGVASAPTGLFLTSFFPVGGAVGDFFAGGGAAVESAAVGVFEAASGLPSAAGDFLGIAFFAGDFAAPAGGTFWGPPGGVGALMNRNNNKKKNEISIKTKEHLKEILILLISSRIE